SGDRWGTMPRHKGGVSPREVRVSEHIKLRQDAGVLEIIFARPEKKNALSNAMYRAVTEALERAHNDPAIRVVLFSAEGDAFTAGNDIADFASAAAGQRDELAACGFITALGRAEKPIMAAVSGLAVGGGTAMLLPDRIGHARAFAMFALGESLSGREAFALGLANKVLPRDDVLPAARAAARKLAAQPLGAIVATKKLMRERERIVARMTEESAVFRQRLQTEEAREAFRAFAERRPPEFAKLAS